MAQGSGYFLWGDHSGFRVVGNFRFVEDCVGPPIGIGTCGESNGKQMESHMKIRAA